MLAFLNFQERDGNNAEDSPKTPPNNKRSQREGGRHNRLRQAGVPHLPEPVDVATVDRTVDGSGQGRVIWQAVSYPACGLCNRSFQRGSLVRVLSRQGNTLFIDELAATSPHASAQMKS